MFQILSQVFEPQKPALSTIRGVWSRWDNENPQPFDGFDDVSLQEEHPLFPGELMLGRIIPQVMGFVPISKLFPHIYIYIPMDPAVPSQEVWLGYDFGA